MGRKVDPKHRPPTSIPEGKDNRPQSLSLSYARVPPSARPISQSKSSHFYVKNSEADWIHPVSSVLSGPAEMEQESQVAT
jgi:hypothetical protein